MAKTPESPSFMDLLDEYLDLTQGPQLGNAETHRKRHVLAGELRKQLNSMVKTSADARTALLDEALKRARELDEIVDKLASELR